jgi:hypothetical protein
MKQVILLYKGSCMWHWASPTLSITMLCIVLSVVMQHSSHNNTQQNAEHCYPESCYAECRILFIVIQSVFMLNVSLCWMPLCWVSWRQKSLLLNVSWRHITCPTPSIVILKVLIAIPWSTYTSRSQMSNLHP